MGVNQHFRATRRAIYYIFPTRVGVNRITADTYSHIVHFPHACGGEPEAMNALKTDIGIFPTRVGVNRAEYPAHSGVYHFPHACGGEP